ncbi:type IV secretory system conjugative DNA transfer family protein [Solihabitans fulvus]|uniref:Type IV secretory system conjugative DNA transfer family protein n=1 Tax=Solihabitans fulvus TaxID=1892852 RepID=A0A5B2WN35_9PSEU|nr:type IV secretory system conjugative DNA transfer family protein [Solihabitans fulvus]KAA2252384.1 type IV secretory system conjugative DNA transfer family protein [Solihabitans fulvus]
MTTPAGADRDFALLALISSTAACLGALLADLVLGLTVTTGLAGGPWQIPDLGEWLTVATHPFTPAASPSPWRPELAGRQELYWTVTAGLFAVTVLVGVMLGVGIRRFVWPPKPGHASRAEVRAELSVSTARRTAAWTRPGLTASQRRRATVEHLAVPCHRTAGGARLWTPLENPTGVIAPTQSGKSRGDLVHKALAAPGMLLCSSTKPDLFEFTALARQRHGQGPVVVFDATGTVTWPHQLRWSPVDGCTDPTVARQRAETMVEAASIDLAQVGGNDKVFRSRATTVLAAYLLAAALNDRTVDALVRWSTTRDTEPVELLKPHYPDLARNLRAELGMVAETSDAVWMSVRRVTEPLMDPRLRDLCSPAPGEGFNAKDFVASQGTLFIIAGEQQAAHAVPLLTALADHLLSTEQELALEQPHKRLDPPASNVLDELPNATPIFHLPKVISDSAGRGVLIHWSTQSLAQLEDLYGLEGARQLVDNTTTLTVFGGLKDQRTLEWISLLTGQHDRRRYQQFSDGLFAPGRTSVGTESVPTYRPGEVRTLRRNHVLIIHRHLRPILAKVLDVSRRPDWHALRRDIRSVRDGQES